MRQVTWVVLEISDVNRTLCKKEKNSLMTILFFKDFFCKPLYELFTFVHIFITNLGIIVRTFAVYKG